MKQRIIVTSEQLRNRAAAVCATIPLNEEHEVIIRPHKRNRSEQANRYYWAIITVIAVDLGYSKDELHEWAKERFLVPIFERDDAAYASMVQAVRETGAESIMAKVVELTSTTQCNSKQMAELIDDIKHHAASLRIQLPAWEDYA